VAIYAVLYRYSEDAASLDEHRPAHREYIRSLVGQGIVASGPMTTSEGPGALLICDRADEVSVEALLNLDPFWERGLIIGREIALWPVVAGSIGLSSEN
jgi:uncharacterized protein YciI